MKEEIRPPDPVSVTLASSIIKPADRLEQLKLRLSDLVWCHGTRDNDHSVCKPFAVLDTALKTVKDLNCSIYEPWPGKERDLIVGQWLHHRLWGCACVVGETISDPKFSRTLDTIDDVAEYLAWRIKELDVSIKGVPRSLPDVPKMYWDRRMERYCVKSVGGGWQHENKENAADRLIEAGLDPKPPRDGLSEVDQALLNIRNYDAVDAMMPLAGYKEGLHKVNGIDILVSTSFSLIEPKQGEFGHIIAILRGALVMEEGKFKGECGYGTFLRHLQSSYLALRSGYKSGSLAVFIVGPPGSGKSFIVKHIVTPLLGGRRADCKDWLSGATQFNDELIQSPVWVLDDSSLLDDLSARRRLGGMLKRMVASPDIPYRGLFKAQVTVPVFIRFFGCLNTDDLDTMPSLAESLEDKYILLQTKNFTMPEGLKPLPKLEERSEFEALIHSELPAFLHWLLGADLSRYADDRFGAKAYKEPSLVLAHEEASGLEAQYLMLCELLCFGNKDAVEMSAAQMWAQMASSGLHASKARAEFKSALMLGRLLGNMERSVELSKVVSVRRLGKNGRLWTIQRPAHSVRRVRSDRRGDRQYGATDTEKDYGRE